MRWLRTSGLWRIATLTAAIFLVAVSAGLGAPAGAGPSVQSAGEINKEIPAKVTDFDRQIAIAKVDLTRMRLDLASLTAQLEAAKAQRPVPPQTNSPAEKAAYHQQVSHWQQQIGLLQHDINGKQQEIKAKEAELAALEKERDRLLDVQKSKPPAAHPAGSK